MAKYKYTTYWVLVGKNETLDTVKALKAQWAKKGVKTKAIKTTNGYTIYNKPIIEGR